MESCCRWDAREARDKGLAGASGTAGSEQHLISEEIKEIVFLDSRWPAHSPPPRSMRLQAEGISHTPSSHNSVQCHTEPVEEPADRAGTLEQREPKSRVRPSLWLQAYGGPRLSVVKQDGGSQLPRPETPRSIRCVSLTRSVFKHSGVPKVAASHNWFSSRFPERAVHLSWLFPFHNDTECE